MVGAAMLLYPSLFLDAGLAMSSILLIILGYLTYITCEIYLKHLKLTEYDI